LGDPAWSKNLACTHTPYTGTGRVSRSTSGGSQLVLRWPASGRRGAVADDARP
jgi:hypothetical protein